MSINTLIRFLVLFLLAQYLEADEITTENENVINAFHDQIHPYIATAQLTMRATLNEIRHKTMALEAETQTTIYAANSYIKNVTEHAKNEVDLYLKNITSRQCAAEANQEFQQLIEHVEAAKNNCIKEAEDDYIPYYRNIFQRTNNLSELQVKIGETPRECRQQNELLQAKVDCVKTTLDVISANAKIIKDGIDEKINIAKLNLPSIYSDLTICYRNHATAMRDKIQEIKETLQNCVQDQI